MHSDWLRGLDFYKQELGILKGRLTEIASKNTGQETMKQVEHYENQFKVQAEQIDLLKHNINENVAEMGREVQDGNAGYIDGALAEKHDKLGQQYVEQENITNNLRHEFNRFAMEWM